MQTFAAFSRWATRNEGEMSCVWKQHSVSHSAESRKPEESLDKRSSSVLDECREVREESRWFESLIAPGGRGWKKGMSNTFFLLKIVKINKKGSEFSVSLSWKLIQVSAKISQMHPWATSALFHEVVLLFIYFCINLLTDNLHWQHASRGEKRFMKNVS